VNAFWDKAVDARDSAKLLARAGYSNGAANRAYYAMFHAARFALGRLDPHLMRSKRHATIIARFSKHIVLDRGADSALGQSFNAAFVLRMKADYDVKGIDLASAQALLSKCESSLSANETMDFGTTA
jgi:uncharacterized protein (UPF0332 family)